MDLSMTVAPFLAQMTEGGCLCCRIAAEPCDSGQAHPRCAIDSFELLMYP